MTERMDADREDLYYTDCADLDAAQWRWRLTGDAPDCGDEAHAEIWASIERARAELRERWGESR